MTSANTRSLDPGQLQRLLDVGRSLVSAHDPDTVLRLVVDAARDLTGARYAAIGVLDVNKRELERFVFVGVDEDLQKRIGDLPRGHGILGELIRHPEPLRLAKISDHPRSYGFPAEHPPMDTFLGVPVMIRGEVYGNLYLTEKQDRAQFDDGDEQLVVVLAEWAAVAVDNARSHETGERRRTELERAVGGLQATVSLSREVGGETDLDRVLELVVKRGRALVEARSVLVLLFDDDELRVAAAAGEISSATVGRSLSDPGSPPFDVSRAGVSQRVSRAAIQRLAAIGIEGESALLVALRSRGRALGVLVAADRLGDDPAFSADDELALDSFATVAATAIAAAQAAEDEKLRLTIASSERERHRWARELHDETLQELGALQVLQQSALQTDDPDTIRQTLVNADAQVERLIAGLQDLINELRPAVLDQLGIAAAVDALVERVASRTQLDLQADVDLAGDPNGHPLPLDADLEATIYRLVQEALTNIVKHAGADKVRVAIEERGGRLLVTVEDDGVGFDPSQPSSGFGLPGMRERVQLAGGELKIAPATRGGTRVSAVFPARP